MPTHAQRPDAMNVARGRMRPTSSIASIAGVAACGMALVLVGCSRESHPLAPVSGKVTVAGVAKEGIHVSFQPIAGGNQSLDAGPGSFGVTDAEGRYCLKCVDGFRPGAVVGPHRVRLAVAGMDRNPLEDDFRPSKSTLPLPFTDGSLIFDVPPGGTEQATFCLPFQ